MKTARPLRRLLCVAAPLPALVLGAVVMRRAGLSPLIWGQNLAVGLILAGACVVLPTAVRLRSSPRRWNVAAGVALVGLLATFLDAGLEGAHRWVRVGPLRIYAGAVCLPVLILASGGLLRLPTIRHRGLLIALASVGTIGLLALQPDAAQASAFAGALLSLLFFGRVRMPVLVFTGLFAVAGAAWAWKRPDPLLPVRHVEGIVGLAAESGWLWQTGALLSLALLPLPFLLARRDSNFPTALALGAYFLLCLLAPFLGAFPVPVLGFGISPILGYFIALGWLAASEDRVASG